MGIFEYISILTAIIIGLGLAQLLSGVARLIQYPGKERVYWVHLFWVGYLFVNMVFWWWWEYRLGELDVWHFQNYLFVLLYAVMLYMCCALLFPTDMSAYEGYEDYLMSRRRWFFCILASTFMIDMYDTWLKGAEHFERAGTEYVVATLTNTVLIGGAALTRSHLYHAAVAVAAFTYQLRWAFLFTGSIA